jgi:hypothetical protein
MPFIHGSCSRCGAALALPLEGLFAKASLVAPLCPSCTDQQFLDEGGVVLTLKGKLEGERFPLGKITITPGAVDALADAGEHAVSFLQRHVQGDWGNYGHCDQIELTEDERRRGWEATDDDAKINKSNLLNRRDTITSSYRTAKDRRVWVITRLDGRGGTTVLLPEEY